MDKILFTILLVMAVACGKQQPFTMEEQKRIGNIKNAIMQVLTITNPDDSLFLRKQAQSLTVRELDSEWLSVLKTRMLLTVNDTANPGVGIAAPQVGISRKLIAVQRFDKEGEPFEFYANPEIIDYSIQKQLGFEGCLSIPDRRDSIWRAEEIVIRYTDGWKGEELISKEEKISGFTSVIFQHEIDHLHGILYIDRAKEKN